MRCHRFCDHGGKKTAETATDRALAAEGRTAHADLDERPSREAIRVENKTSFALPSCQSLTFDVRGGPLAGRPLDGGVRRIRSNSEMTETRERNRRGSLT